MECDVLEHGFDFECSYRPLNQLITVRSHKFHILAASAFRYDVSIIRTALLGKAQSISAFTKILGADERTEKKEHNPSET